MRTAMRIFGLLILSMSILMCALSISRAQTDRETLARALADARTELAQYQSQIDQMSGQARAMMDRQMAAAEKQLYVGPLPSTYLIVEIFLSALLILAVAFGIFLFRPNPNISKFLVVAAVLSALAYFVSPDLSRGPHGGMESRTLALASGIPVLIGGMFAWRVSRKNTVRIQIPMAN